MPKGSDKQKKGVCTVNVQKIPTLFSFCSQIKWVFFRAGIHKILVSTANGKHYDQKKKQSDLGLSLSRPFWQATSFRNF